MPKGELDQKEDQGQEEDKEAVNKLRRQKCQINLMRKDKQWNQKNQ